MCQLYGHIQAFFIMKQGLYYVREIEGDGIECLLSVFDQEVFSAGFLDWGSIEQWQALCNALFRGATEIFRASSEIWEYFAGGYGAIVGMLDVISAAQNVPLSLPEGTTLPCFEWLDGIGQPYKTLTSSYQFQSGSATCIALPQLVPVLTDLGFALYLCIGLSCYYYKPRDWSAFLPDYDANKYLPPWQGQNGLFYLFPQVDNPDDYEDIEPTIYQRKQRPVGGGYYEAWDAHAVVGFLGVFSSVVNNADMRLMLSHEYIQTRPVAGLGERIECLCDTLDGRFGPTDYVSRIPGSLQQYNCIWEFDPPYYEECRLPMRRYNYPFLLYRPDHKAQKGGQHKPIIGTLPYKEFLPGVERQFGYALSPRTTIMSLYGVAITVNNMIVRSK